MTFPIRIPLLALAAWSLVPAIAEAAPRSTENVHHESAPAKRPRHARAMKSPKARSCAKAPIEVVAGAESAKLALAECDGAAAPAAVERLSSLARARGSNRLDGRLVERLELAVDHFRKGSDIARVVLVSGYRPRSSGSYHATGRALDFRIDGVANDVLVEFCKTLPDTGCGYYPNAGFVHMDVRDPGTGHVAWTDVSHPGEAPRYVPAEPSGATALPSLPARDGAAREREREEDTSKDDGVHAL